MERTNSPSSGSPPSTTVRFNVGGKIYEVSRSLLAQHPNTMLTRMASDTWSPPGIDSNGPPGIPSPFIIGGAGAKQPDDLLLFIERDSERFRFVLDYMRDGGIVDLPPSVPKNSLIRDLTYYGFENVDPSKLFLTDTHHIYQACARNIESCILELAKEQELTELAQFCLSSFRLKGSLIVNVYPGSADKEKRLYSAARDLQSEVHQKGFNAILGRVGFELKLYSLENNGQNGHYRLIGLGVLNEE